MAETDEGRLGGVVARDRTQPADSGLLFELEESDGVTRRAPWSAGDAGGETDG